MNHIEYTRQTNIEKLQSIIESVGADDQLVKKLDLVKNATDKQILAAMTFGIRPIWQKLIEDIRRDFDAADTEKMRYVSLADSASEPHGKSWVCEKWQVRKLGVPAEWVGQDICYVYVNGEK